MNLKIFWLYVKWRDLAFQDRIWGCQNLEVLFSVCPLVSLGAVLCLVFALQFFSHASALYHCIICAKNQFKRNKGTKSTYDVRLNLKSKWANIWKHLKPGKYVQSLPWHQSDIPHHTCISSKLIHFRTKDDSHCSALRQLTSMQVEFDTISQEKYWNYKLP